LKKIGIHDDQLSSLFSSAEDVARMWERTNAVPWRAAGDKAPADALSRVIAVRVHLDNSDADNGPLRVIPGTHMHGVLGDDQIARLVRVRHAVDCLVAAGGVIAMRPLILHASSKARSDRPRRVLHIEYADSRDIGDGLTLALA
jgi:Phytanoyl-CoA dioxygenase (PhyH)